jgi:NADPH-dependent curcumin reductase CurA
VSVTQTQAVFLVRPCGSSGPVADDFAIRDLALPELGDGQVLVHNEFMSVDPSMRGRLEPGDKHYTTNFVPGEPLDGAAIGRVIASASDAIGVGACVRHRLGWREHSVVDASTAVVVDDAVAPLNVWLGALGQTGFTAYVGLRRIGEFKAGDSVFVSGAAGAVGSMVGQFARLLGASRVIGSAGGEKKKRVLIDSFGFDDAFDYRAEAARDALTRLMPDGTDVYFDNVGGEQLVAALHSLRIGGRVALCGMISNFSDQAPQDIGVLIQAVLKRNTLRGFIVRDHEDMRANFITAVSGWLTSGQLVSTDTIYHGLGSAVEALFGVMSGANVGKMLVRL